MIAFEEASFNLGMIAGGVIAGLALLFGMWMGRS